MLEITPHYLVITVGTAGDIHPFIRIASALQALGRKVTFITNTYHVKLIQGAGLPFIGIGTDEDYLRILANPNLWHPKKGFSALMAGYREQVTQIHEAIQAVSGRAPQVAIAHPFAVPGAAISREQGFISSIVAAYLAPSNLRTCYDPLNIGPTSVPRWVPMSWRRTLWRLVEKGWIDPVAIAQINAVREPLGMPKVDSLLTHITETPDLSVTLFPSWFAPTVPDWPRPLITGDFQMFEVAKEDALGKDVSAFLAAGERPLIFTAGTGNLHAADFFKRALSAVNMLGRRAIFLARERAQLPANLPESILWQPYVPLSALLPHAALLVHHGGIGTTAEALRSGTPQLITPFAWDQFDNGARIASLGVGMVAPAKGLRPRKLARRLQTLATSDAIRARCSQYAAQFNHSDNSTALCGEIERVLLPKQDDANALVRRIPDHMPSLAASGDELS